MTELSVSNLNVAELNHLAEEMLPSTDKKIFFEGKINKKYYQKIELENIHWIMVALVQI